MAISKNDEQLTLGQIQECLDVPQHVLIHLCEKGVILPDFSDTDGRGRARLFSKRNLIEFAIALHIRKFQIPVMVTKPIIAVLRKFEEKVNKKIGGFSLVDLGKSPIHPKLIVYIEEGESLIFSLKSKDNSMLLKCSISAIEQSKAIHFAILDKLSHNYTSRLEINISKITESL